MAYLYNTERAPKTISTYISAIGYIHKILNLPDPSNSFIVSKLIAGAHRTKPSFDLRLPITIQILDKLVDAVQHAAANIFEITLFGAMFLFAFYTFARIGELTIQNNSKNQVLQFQDISFGGTSTNQTVTVTFKTYKHNTTGTAHMISFSRGHTVHDPVQSLLKFTKLRGNKPGPLFCMLSGDAVKRHAFDTVLHKTLKFCRLDSTRYKGHSFRIGAASYRSEQGDTDSQIRSLGRWNSNAFLKYIRTYNT